MVSASWLLRKSSNCSACEPRAPRWTSEINKVRKRRSGLSSLIESLPMDAHLTDSHDRAMTTEAVHGTANADPAGTRISPHSRLIANSSATRQSGDAIVIAAQTVAVNHGQRLLGGTIARSRGAARPSCCLRSPSIEWRAQGKPGARRTHSLACRTKKHTSVVATGSPKQSDLPCAMVYGLFRALLGDRAFLPPSPADRYPQT